MRLEKWALTAEIVSAFAIVVTLIFLAIEIRVSSRAQSAQTYQEISSSVREIISAIPFELRYKIRAGESVTTAERAEYGAFIQMSLRTYESWWRHWQMGVLTDEEFFTYMSHMEITLGDEFSQDVWERQTVRYFPEFVEFVNDYMRERRSLPRQ